MNDPTFYDDCPLCNGTGMIDSPKCGIPPDTEVDCRNCANELTCGESTICEMCDGSGQVYTPDLTRKSLKYYLYEG